MLNLAVDPLGLLQSTLVNTDDLHSFGYNMNHRWSIVLDSGTLEIETDEDMTQLAGFASRLNSSRDYLFVSKVLGKHYPSRPSDMADIHHRLAKGIRPLLRPGPSVVIGFAETATGLAYGVFEALGLEDSYYHHTTRYVTGDPVALHFREVHSHAPKQCLYLPSRSRHMAILENAANVLLVDDEFTTGNTLLSMVAGLKGLGLRAAFIGACILDWTAKEDVYGIPITSIVKGRHRFSSNVPSRRIDVVSERTIPFFIPEIRNGYGRFGCDRLEMDFGSLLGTLPPMGSRILVLGTGEFMCVSYLLSRWLEESGFDVFVQATTRSPVSQGGEISSIMRFRDNYGEGIDNFLYNVAERDYDVVYVCYEADNDIGAGGLMEQMAGVSPLVRPLKF